MRDLRLIIKLVFRNIKTNITSNFYKENYATKLRKENITKVGSHHGYLIV